MKIRKAAQYIAVPLVLGFLVLLIVLQGRTKTVSSDRFCLGTYCRITAYGDPKKAQKGIDQSWEAITVLENCISANLSYSEVSQVNEAAGSGKWTAVSDATYDLIQSAFEVSGQTGGALNPAMGSIVKLWAIGTDDARVPSIAETNALLPACAIDNVQFIQEDGKNLVRLMDEGTRLDLGAVGKGYAADLVRLILKANGIENALIDFGGNVLVLGSRPETFGSRPFVVGLRDPKSTNGGFFRTLKVSDASVVTSGSYERFVQGEDGLIYSHIMDPSTGRSVETDIASVSIIGESSLVCDALSTSLFILGPEKTKDLMELCYPDYCAVFLMDDGEVVGVGNLAIFE